MAETSVYTSRKTSKSLKSTVPKEVAEKLDLKKGDKIEWTVEGGKISVKKRS